MGQIGGDVRGAIGVEGRVDMYYVLPGHNELEAQQVMGSGISSSTSRRQWIYGHPYSQTNIPLPCPPPEGVHNLGHYVPSFEDDPKNRFMDEIAFTDTPASPRKRPRMDPPREDGDDAACREGEREKDRKGRPMGELSKVEPDEFWERMSFRQECVAGTGRMYTAPSRSAIPRCRRNPLLVVQRMRAHRMALLKTRQKFTSWQSGRKKGVRMHSLGNARFIRYRQMHTRALSLLGSWSLSLLGFRSYCGGVGQRKQRHCCC